MLIGAIPNGSQSDLRFHRVARPKESAERIPPGVVKTTSAALAQDRTLIRAPLASPVPNQEAASGIRHWRSQWHPNH